MGTGHSIRTRVRKLMKEEKVIMNLEENEKKNYLQNKQNNKDNDKGNNEMH